MAEVQALTPAYLEPIAEHHEASFARAQPFPHVVIDDLFDPTVLAAVLDEYPSPEDPVDWQRFKQDTSVKLALRNDWQMGSVTRQFIHELNGSAFVQFLERLTGIDGLIPDPHYEGGGLHQIERGGYLKVHADFNVHERLRLDRRLNALIYLNRDWQDDWGGCLELWDKSMQRMEHRIVPVFNRMVVFATTDWSFHGHPDPLTCPPGTTRRSIATYYYTSGRPAEEASQSHNTLYQRRPGERLLRDWLPPVAIEAARKLRARR